MPIIYDDGNYLTEKGRALIAKSLASETKIEFTRVTVGSGAIPEDTEPKEMLDLVNYEVDGVISDISTPIPGEAQIVFQVFSRDVKVGFLATEAAIWADDPDEGEILYTYIVLYTSPEWIRAASDPVQKFAEFTCINIVGTALVDMTVVNPEAITTRQFLLESIERHNSDKNAHPALIDKIKGAVDKSDQALETANKVKQQLENLSVPGITKQEIIIPTTGWVQSNPEEYEGLSVDIPVEGVTEDMIPIVIVPQRHIKTIGERKFSPCVKSDDGYIRLYSKASPPEPINATLVLLITSGGATGGGGNYQLPKASADRLGGVKIGENIDVTEDGTISVDKQQLVTEIMPTVKETTAMLDDVFKK